MRQNGNDFLLSVTVKVKKIDFFFVFRTFLFTKNLFNKVNSVELTYIKSLKFLKFTSSHERQFILSRPDLKFKQPDGP